jgi:parvulin-like peptidyl-prolyl isomerase
VRRAPLAPRGLPFVIVLASALTASAIRGVEPPAGPAGSAGSIRQPSGDALPAGSTTTEAGVVARIGDLDVKIDEIRTSLQRLDLQDQAAISRDPALLNQVVRSLLVQRIMYREAQSKKWEQQPEVKAQLDRVREAAITESYLEAMSRPPESYPGDAEVRAAYEANKSSFLIPRQYRLAQIFIAMPEGADKSAEAQAQSRFEAVKKKLAAKDADFAAVAKTDSEEVSTAPQGGEIGWLTEAQLQPGIRAAVSRLTAGAVSEGVRLADGWHIVKCLEIREPFTPTLEQLRPRLVQQLRIEKTRANSQAYLARLLQQYPVAINELALSKALLPKAGK